MDARLIFVHALSPLHAGTGQGVGVIDLPIAREKATGIPYLPGSSLKGVLRETCPASDRAAIFGPEPTNAEEYASSVHFSDQRLLLLPVRSLKGTFAWVTSPYVLRRFAREVQDVGLAAQLPAIPQPAEPQETQRGQAMVAQQGSALGMPNGQQPLVVLEDLDLESAPDATTNAWATWVASYVFPGQPDWQTAFRERFCIVHDDILSFLLTTATEVIARIKLQEHTKTVQRGGLWYEEALPTETILTGLVAAMPTKNAGKTAKQVFDVVDTLTRNQTLQLGGKATVGRGLCRIQMAAQGGNGNANS
jgi:CRISPR-associated protein Cmr4